MVKILQLGNPILRQKSSRIPINKIQSEDIRTIERQIVEIMKGIKNISSSHGSGLSAPQIGHALQIIVICFNNKYATLINPKIIYCGKKTFLSNEGCLSFFGLRGYVRRHKEIEVCAYNRSGKKIKYRFKDGLSALVQHEIDHLNGILFIDRIKNFRKIFAVEEFYKNDPKKIKLIKKIMLFIA